MDIVAIIPGLMGVVVGWILGLMSSFIQQWREQRQRTQSVRTLVRLEIDHNLALLRDAYTYIEERTDCLEKHGRFLDKLRSQRRTTMITLPEFLSQMAMPVFSTVAWESQLPHIPSAFNVETMQQIYLFYARLDRIVRIPEGLEKRDIDYAFESYKQCIDIMKQTIDTGNPLASS